MFLFCSISAPLLKEYQNLAPSWKHCFSFRSLCWTFWSGSIVPYLRCDLLAAGVCAAPAGGCSWLSWQRCWCWRRWGRAADSSVIWKTSASPWRAAAPSSSSTPPYVKACATKRWWRVQTLTQDRTFIWVLLINVFSNSDAGFLQ